MMKEIASTHTHAASQMQILYDTHGANIVSERHFKQHICLAYVRNKDDDDSGGGGGDGKVFPMV